MSILLKRPAPRRDVLRGMLGGAAVSVGLLTIYDMCLIAS